MADRMGDLAALDSYDPFAAEQFVPQPIADALPGIAQTDYAKLMSGRSPDDSPVLYPMRGGGITQQDMDNAIGIGMGVSGGGLSITKAPLFHGSPETNLKVLNESVRGPLGPGVYTSPAEQIAGSYGHGGKVYELPKAQRDIYQGAGHRTDEEWFGFKDDKKRLLEAAAPEKRQAVSDVLEKMWSSDGYPTYQRLRNIYGGDEGAQNLYKNAGFQGISGLVDGPETLLFGPQSLMPGIKAYHGSPHDFDRFDLSKIGTGEGAQAYGHGLYFAENEGVARSYRDALSDTLVGGKPWDVNSPIHKAAAWTKDHGSREAAAAYAEMMSKKHLDPFYDDVARVLRGKAEIPEVKPGGKMYEVNINADPTHFLDWDKPLSKMSPEVQRAVEPRLSQIPKEYRSADPEGEYIWRAMHPQGGLDKTMDFSRTLPQQATERLREAGIPGIKYLDQGSRGAGTGSSNYVVFNDKLIDILKKYGIAGVPTGMGAFAAQDQYEGQ